MSTRAQLSETINRLLPGEKNKRIRESILEAATYSGSRTDQLRKAIDDANRLKTGLLVKGEIEFPTDIEAILQSYVWVVDFAVKQPAGISTLVVDAPHATIERTDVFTGNAAGVITYYPGTIDSLGNSYFPAIPTTEVILEVVTRNPDSSNTVDPGTVSPTDWISKSATALQLMAGPLAITPLAGAIQDMIGTDANGQLRIVPASRAGVYTTIEGDGGFVGGGWSKLMAITIDPVLQINYVITFQMLGVTPGYEKGDMWCVFRVDAGGDIILNSLKLFGEFTPERYKLVKVDGTHYELYVKHDVIDSLYSFRPIMLFGNDWRYTFFQQSAIVENLPAGNQYGFSEVAAKEVQLQVNATHIQWRLAGDPDWINLLALEDITGYDGREIELQKSATHIQWRYVGDPDWINLVPLIDLKGAPGDDGLNGWSPVFAVVTDSERRVLQVSSWTGGTGSPPASGLFVGATGFEALIANGVDIRGATGPAGLGGGGGSGAYLTDLDTWPVLKFDKNYRYIHDMAGPITISAEFVAPLAVVGNFCTIYIKADGTNKPLLTGAFEVVWDNWVNTSGHWNRFYGEYSPEGKVVLQIENAHQGTANDGTGLTTLTISFDDNYTTTHIITNSTKIVPNPTGALVGYSTTLYVKADGVNKPFWGTDVIVTYDNYLNVVDVWNRIKLEWRPESKAIAQIINT